MKEEEVAKCRNQAKDEPTAARTWVLNWLIGWSVSRLEPIAEMVVLNRVDNTCKTLRSRSLNLAQYVTPCGATAMRKAESDRLPSLIEVHDLMVDIEPRSKVVKDRIFTLEQSQ